MDPLGDVDLLADTVGAHGQAVCLHGLAAIAASNDRVGVLRRERHDLLVDAV